MQGSIVEHKRCRKKNFFNTLNLFQVFDFAMLTKSLDMCRFIIVCTVDITNNLALCDSSHLSNRSTQA